MKKIILISSLLASSWGCLSAPVIVQITSVGCEMAGTVCFAEIDQSIGDEGCMSQTIRWQGHQANGLDTLAFFQAAVLAKRSVHVNVKGCFSGTTDPYLTYFSLLDNT